MASPVAKSMIIETLLKEVMGINRVAAIEADNCAICQKEATLFTDELSKKEYTISGMCQCCQNKIFNYGY